MADSASRNRPTLLPSIALCLLSLAVTFCVWLSMRHQEKAQITRAVRDETVNLSARMDAALERQAGEIVHLAEDWTEFAERGVPLSDEEMQDRAAKVAATHPALLGITWVDSSLRVRWISPRGRFDGIVGMSLATDVVRREFLEASRRRKAPAVTRCIPLLTGDAGILVGTPIFRGDELAGFIVGAFPIRSLLDTVVAEAGSRGFSVAVYEGDRRIYGAGAGDDRPLAAIYGSQELYLYDVTWKVRVQPFESALSLQDTHVDEAVLAGGLLVSFLLALLLHLGTANRLRARDAGAANLTLEAEIAHREAAEIALRASEEYLRTVIENVTDVVFSLDETGVVTYMSPSCRETLGFPPEHFVGRPGLEIVHPEDRGRVEDVQNAASRSPRAVDSVEFRVVHGDGSLRILQGRGCYFGGALPAVQFVVNLRDVTEARLRERELGRRAGISELKESFRGLLALTEEVPVLLERCCGMLVERAGATSVQAWLLDEEGRSLDPPIGAGASGLSSLPAFSKQVQGILERVVRGRSSFQGEIDATSPERVTLACYPLIAGDAVIGALLASFVVPQDRTILDALETLASGLAIAVRQKQVQAKLAEQRAILRYVLDTIPHFVFWKNKDLEYLGCNAIFARSAGVASPEEIVGKTDYDLAWKKEEADWYRSCDRDVIERGEPLLGVEETQLRADGEETTLLTSKVPMRDAQGRITGILGVYGDITERRRKEETMRLLHTAVEQAAEAVVVTDAAGVIQYVNPAFETNTGYSKAEVLKGKPSLLRSGAHDAAFYRQLWDTIGRGEVWKGRFRNRRKDGTLFDEDATISAVRDESGGIRSFVAVKRDVTAEIALEAQLRQAQKLEAIGQLAAGIAHEINTPVQYVGDNVRFLGEAFGDLLRCQTEVGKMLGTAGPPREELVEPLRRLVDELDVEYLLTRIPGAIEHSIEGLARVGDIVRAMKEFSHPSEEKLPTDLNHAIETTITVARNEWKYVAEVVTDLEPDLPPVVCVRGEVNQAVLNMIVNAAHAIAAAAGGDSRGKGTITIRTRKGEGCVEIEISDTGTGIPAGIRERIFDPFFTTKEVGKGTGQGLTIAHSAIVKRHGGTISVSSEVGKGTTFVIRLPVTSAVSAEPESVEA